VLLEACSQLGGTTGIAVGSFTAAGTKYQRAAGIDDDPAWHEADIAKFAPQHEPKNNAALRGLLAREAAGTQEWLASLGVEFHGPKPEPPNRVPRMHNVVPNGSAYVAALYRQAIAQKTEIRIGHRATRLHRQPGGSVVGVAIEGSNIRALRGVILAAGDYSNGLAVKSDYLAQEVASIEGVNPNSNGDGHRMARDVGAALVNMELVYGPEIRFAAPWQHPERSLFQKGAILVNSEGRRFADENDCPELAIPRQPGKIAYILLDRNLAKIFSAWPNFISTAPQIAYAYMKDYARLRPDVYAESRDLAGLARRIGAEPSVLADTVAQYNRSAQGPALESAPFYLLGPVKSWIVTTEGGVAINDRMEALDDEGRVIPGLYAAGSNGMGGVVLWGHGLHIAWAMTSGRIAGRNAASRR
jgi:succinate dehydrogenase/fumarate reductase flavoprotein subunit